MIETKKLIPFGEISESFTGLIEAWYDGYNFGGRKVFNPWSLLNAIRGLVNGLDAESAFQPYWVMTSGNDIIDDVIEKIRNIVQHRPK